MTASFFQSLDRHAVEYLLISGQATVLYGAATFSEDIDLWVKPGQQNLDRFASALREQRARYYKLTPRMTAENAERGHGFHFIIEGSDEPVVYLDVMGVPPRTESFVKAAASAAWMETEWGRIHVVGIKALVELKKTQRLEDYPVVGKLALAWLDQPECARTTEDFRWATSNIFTLEQLQSLVRAHPSAVTGMTEAAEVSNYARQLLGSVEPSEQLENEVAALMQGRIHVLQQADRAYWRPIIVDLRILRAEGSLVPEGMLV